MQPCHGLRQNGDLGNPLFERLTRKDTVLIHLALGMRGFPLVDPVNWLCQKCELPLVSRIFITGRACRLPGARNVEELAKLLLSRGDAVTEVPRDRWAHEFFLHPVPGTKGKTYTFAAGIVPDLWAFDPAVFGISPREAGQMDPQQRLLLHVVWEALEDAGLPPDRLAGQHVGVFVGCSAMAHAARLAQDAAITDAYLMTGNTLALVSNRISHVLDLRGPSMTVDTACSSSLVAMRLAEEALLRGEVDIAVVAGVNAILDPIPYVGFSSARMLSPKGRCQPFSASADGYVRAEGAVALVLERRSRQSLGSRRAHAVLVGVETNTDGRTVNVALPSTEGQAALLRRVYDRTGVDPSALAFVEAHGTGTLAGDPVEAAALGQVLGKARRAPLPIGSVKSNIGHLEPASGVAGFLKALIALERRVLPASLHAENPNPDIPFEDLNLVVAQREIALPEGELFAGVSSFGFGGANAHAIIATAEKPAFAKPARDPGTEPILLLSAAGEESLRQSMADWRDLVAGETDAAGMRELCAQAASYRGRLAARAAVICDGADAAADALECGASGQGTMRLATAVTDLREEPAVFVFSGNGSQYSGMCLAALDRDAAYARGLRRIDRAFRKVAGWSILERLKAADLDAQLRDAAVAQPLLFADQMALAWALDERGLKPAAVMGHSGGEVAAACVAGALSLQQAIEVIYRRSLALQTLRGRGTMAAVQAPVEEVRSAIAAFGGGVEIAAENSPRSVSIVGEAEVLEAFLRHARRVLRWPAVRLAIDYPYHGSAVDEVKGSLRAGLAGLAPTDTSVPFISSVTAEVMTGSRLDAHYWCENVRKPVAFSDAMACLKDMGFRAFVEIGPSPVLQSYMSACLEKDGFAVMASLDRSGQDETVNPVAVVVARALVNGIAVDQDRVLSRPGSIREDLPKYRWNSTEIRIDRTPGILNRFGDGLRQHPLLGREEGVDAGLWYGDLDVHMRPELADHRVGGRVVVPGTALAEMAFAAARAVTGADQIELRDLDIPLPIVLGRQTMTEIQIRALTDQARIQIAARMRGDGGPYRTHMQSRFYRMEADAPAEVAPDPAPDDRDRDGEGVYVAARRIGLDYGPAFRLVQRARVVGTGVVEVFLADSLQVGGPESRTLLDVIGADAAFHGLIPALEGTDAGRGGVAYVPVRIGRFALHRPFSRIATARVRITRIGTRSVLAGFTMFDAQGRVVALLEDVRFQAARATREISLVQHGFRQIAVPLAGGTDGIGIDWLTAVRTAASREDVKSRDEGFFLIEAAAQAVVASALRSLADGDVILNLPSSEFTQGVLGIALRADIVEPVPVGWRLTAKGATLAPDGLLSEIAATCPELGAERAILAHLVETLPGLLVRDQDDLPDAAAHFGRAALDNLSDGSVFRKRRLLALTQAVLDVALAWPKGRACRIAVIGDGASKLLGPLLHRLAPGQASFAQIVRPGDGEASSIAPDRVALIEATEDALHQVMPFDVILSEGILAAWPAPEKLMPLLTGALARDGHWLALEEGPSDFADLVWGMEGGWYAGGMTPDGPLSRFRMGEDWSELARQSGQSVVGSEALPDGCGLASLVVIRGGPRQPNRAEVDRDVAAAVTAGLLRPVDSITTLAPGRVVAVFPRGGAGLDPVAATSARVLALRDLLAATETPLSRLVIVAPGGSGLGPGTADPLQSGLWVFVRSVANEHPTLPIFRYDPDAGLSPNAAGQLVGQCEASPSTETEVLLGPSGIAALRVMQGVAFGDAGERFAQRAVLSCPVVGGLDELRWTLAPRQEPGEGEVEIEVAATGLNYRDVMWTMGLLPEEALERGFAGSTIGIECAGRVLRCGPGVTRLKPGDAVMTFGPSCFASHIVVGADRAVRLPETFEPTAAATIPVAFFTAWYAMVTLGRLAKGDWILVHGGAGGVGLAAIQIARHLGLRVIATAGSSVKRAVLRAEGVEHVLDSRSLRFGEEVRRITGGRGVDAVLNSLAGEGMERSLACLAPFGRFLELGKQDFYANTALGLRPLKENISYFGVDVDQLMAARPDMAAQVLAEVMENFETGALRPLPYRAFTGQDAVAAFRLMQKSGHLGKVVISPLAPQDVLVRDRVSGDFRPGEATHLVVGGLGGLGLEVAEWLVEAGARRIALMGRRADLSPDAARSVARWRAKGVDLRVVACDVTDEAALAKALDDLRPLAGVIHSAMVLEDMPLSSITEDVLKRVLPAKIAGAEALDRLTAGDRLDYFVLFSSMATLIGNHGQSAYVAANGFLEGLARRRREAGLPGLAIGWGAISDVGYLSRDKDTAALVRRMSGGLDFTGAQVTRALDRLLSLGEMVGPVVHVSPMGWNAVSVTLRTLSEPAFGLLKLLGKRAEGDGGEEDLRHVLTGMTQGRAEERLTAWLVARIAHILQVPEKSVSAGRSVSELGIDSLMGVELGLTLQEALGDDIPVTMVSDALSIQEISARIVRHLHGASDDTTRDKLSAEDARLAVQHLGLLEDQAAPARAVAE